MAKGNHDEQRSPDRPPDHTVWWAIVEVLTSGKMYGRLFRLLCLIAVVIVVLAALAVIALVLSGTDASTLLQEFAAVAVGFRIKLR
ncbi:hypothetical protein [Amycolatopsis lexingtonensis]|uniref:hypothetical protein n=1 Tax=Amycolatopsis lexingtonensis TaxID=218822 RepID=UPI003F722889